MPCVMVIWVSRSLNKYSLPVDTAPFITGCLYRRAKSAFPTGRPDIRAKLRVRPRRVACFQLLPENEGWPDGGEIDIMERLNNDTIAHQTVHSAYTRVLGIKDNPKQGGTGTINRDDYNVYSGGNVSGQPLSFYQRYPHICLSPYRNRQGSMSSRSQTKSFICCSICS